MYKKLFYYIKAKFSFSRRYSYSCSNACQDYWQVLLLFLYVCERREKKRQWNKRRVWERDENNAVNSRCRVTSALLLKKTLCLSCFVFVVSAGTLEVRKFFSVLSHYLAVQKSSSFTFYFWSDQLVTWYQ